MSNHSPSQNLVYVATKYPLFSETFIYEEIIALKKLGYKVRFFALYPTGNSSHRFTEALADSVFYLPRLISFSSLRGHLHFIGSAPKQYFGALSSVVRDTVRSPKIMLKSLYAFGKGVSLANILRENSPDHIHAHWATMPTTTAFVASQLTGVSYSFTSHAWDIYKEPAMLATKLDTAAFHVTISQYNQEYIQALYPLVAEKTLVSRCGVDVERFGMRQMRPPNQQVEILFVGRLVEKKGTLKLVEACAELHQQGYEFICHIVGDGPERAQVEGAISQHHLQDVVKLTGALPQEQLRQYWATASMFVLPCAIEKNGNRDGIPVVLMEAMAVGIPVISTDISGIPELIEDGVTGLLSADDPQELSEAMKKLFDDAALAEMLIKNARLKVEREYNIQLNTQKKAALFKAYFANKEKING